MRWLNWGNILTKYFSGFAPKGALYFFFVTTQKAKTVSTQIADGAKTGKKHLGLKYEEIFSTQFPRWLFTQC